MRRRAILFWVVAIGFILLDQLVKLWARHSLSDYESSSFPWVGVFEIKLTFNQGIAFGFFQGKGVLLAPIAVIISGATVYHITKHPEETKWNTFGFGLLTAGAIGNLIDRLAFQRVTDIFWFRLINFPVFNVADSCITVATIMLIIGWWADSTQRKTETETQPLEAK
jgi:signal peptidase II